jgi:hypothetical protein
MSNKGLVVTAIVTFAITLAIHYFLMWAVAQ